MMVSLLFYSLCRGVYSSRRIEVSCHERIDFMAVTGMAKPNHTTICNFRNDHRAALAALGALFVQVLALCRDAGLAKMGHVSLDGTKIRAARGDGIGVGRTASGPQTQGRGRDPRGQSAEQLHGSGEPELPALPVPRPGQGLGGVDHALHGSQSAQTGTCEGLRARLSAEPA